MNIQEFDFSVDLLKVILWQYNDAEKIQSLLEQKQSWYNSNQTDFWQNWYRDVFDLTTANDFGLAVWAIILEIPLIACFDKSEDDAPAFGFGGNYQNFGSGNFFATQANNIKLTTEQKRLIIKLRYFQLVSKGTIPEINLFLKSLFDEAYVLDTYNMQYVSYVINTEISSEFQFILQTYDLLPRPAGVGKRIIYGRNDLFGFEQHYQNFSNSVLANITDYKV